MPTLSWRDEIHTVAGIDLHIKRGGQGPPLLWLDGGTLPPGDLQHHQQLADHFDVYIPHHPGFGVTPRPEWIARINDLAVFYLWMLDELGLDNVHLFGHGMGGWLAADMATLSPRHINRLVLADAIGIKPHQADILDIFILTPPEIRAAEFHRPEQVAEWKQLFEQESTPEAAECAEDAIEMLMRLCWKPYMHDPRLPFLLPRIQQPSLIVWGQQDAIVPLECGRLYQQGITGSELFVIEACGHYPQLEKPAVLTERVIAFLS